MIYLDKFIDEEKRVGCEDEYYQDMKDGFIPFELREVDNSKLPFDPIKLNKVCRDLTIIKNHMDLIKFVNKNEGLCSKEMAIKYRLYPPDFHAKIFIINKTGILDKKKEGSFVFLYVNLDRMSKISNSLSKFFS